VFTEEKSGWFLELPGHTEEQFIGKKNRQNGCGYAA
jgi:hypothetical protein